MFTCLIHLYSYCDHILGNPYCNKTYRSPAYGCLNMIRWISAEYQFNNIRISGSMLG